MLFAFLQAEEELEKLEKLEDKMDKNNQRIKKVRETNACRKLLFQSIECQSPGFRAWTGFRSGLRVYDERIRMT